LSSPDAATSNKTREKILSRDKEKDNDRHNLRHKSRQVFHQVPDSLPPTEEKPQRQDVGDDGPRRRTLSGDTARTQDNRLQAPEISADGSALSVTPPEKVMCLPFLTVDPRDCLFASVSVQSGVLRRLIGWGD